MADAIDPNDEKKPAEMESTDLTEPTSTPTPTLTQKVRIRLNPQLDLLMCKTISEEGANVPPLNQKTKRMANASNLFVNALPQRVQDVY